MKQASEFKIVILVLLSKLSYASTSFAKEQNLIIPDKETAIAIAVAVWKPIYGEKIIEKQKPFNAKLKGDVWIVYGSLPEGITRGGTLEAEISSIDGRILRVGHGR